MVQECGVGSGACQCTQYITVYLCIFARKMMKEMVYLKNYCKISGDYSSLCPLSLFDIFSLIHSNVESVACGR